MDSLESLLLCDVESAVSDTILYIQHNIPTR
jgi:hypothetical protein